MPDENQKNIPQPLLNDHYLQSFADGEISKTESGRVWRAILADPKFLRKYNALIAQREILRKWWRSLTRREKADILPE